jgi:hypothetical protein
MAIKSHGHIAHNRLAILSKILIDFGKSRQYTATQDIFEVRHLRRIPKGELPDSLNGDSKP